jgi:capsular exopolysaccharide synthesis family protein
LGKITKALQKATEERLIQPQNEDIRGEEQEIALQEPPELNINQLDVSTIDPRIITYFDSKSIVSEQYKILATNLLALNRSNPPRTLAITSSIAGEGKTVTALNLAITLSKALHNPRIVLIDADMRKSQMIKYLGVSERKGLSEYLDGQASLEEVLFNLDIENLSFIAAGATALHPAELLASRRMKDLLQILQGQYDFVIIDTPPVIPVTDAVIVGGNVDGVLMVIESGHTQRGIVSRSSELLLQANANILGYTLSNVEYFVPDYIYRYL